jgi:hypothetical protein
MSKTLKFKERLKDGGWGAQAEQAADKSCNNPLYYRKGAGPVGKICADCSMLEYARNKDGRCRCLLIKSQRLVHDDAFKACAAFRQGSREK